MAEHPDREACRGTSEALDFEPVASRGPRIHRGLIASLLIIALLGGGVWAGWTYLADKPYVDAPYDVPTIRADLGPIKVRPESPGGMEVPHRDRLVYDRMAGAREAPEVERLLPPPETPLPPPAPPPPADRPPPTTASPPATAAPSAPADVVAAEPPALPEPKELALPEPKRPTPRVSGEPPPAKDAYSVQLAAVRSPELVKGEWERLRRRNQVLLGGLELTVTRADLGPGKGVYYRLRAGPIAGEAAARALCAALAQRGFGCMVVRPEG